MPETFRKNIGPFTTEKLVSMKPTKDGFRVGFSDDTAASVDGNAVKLLEGNVLELVANKTDAGVEFQLRVLPPGAPAMDSGDSADSGSSSDIDFCVGFPCGDAIPCPDPSKPNMDCNTGDCVA